MILNDESSTLTKSEQMEQSINEELSKGGFSYEEIQQFLETFGI